MYSEDTFATKKMVFLGLAESGKSSMINGVIRGVLPKLGDKYDATINYLRLSKLIGNTEIQILDLGGQTRFLDRFTGDLSEFVFSDMDSGAFIFVVDALKIAQLSRSKYYFDLSLKKLEHYNTHYPVYIFLNKMDLIPQNKIEKTSKLILEYLTNDYYQINKFFITSVFSPSIFIAIGEVLECIIKIRNDITPILEELIENNPSIVDHIQILTKEGAIIVSVKNKTKLLDLTFEETRRIFQSSVEKMNKTDELNTKVIIDESDKRHLTLVNFMETGLVVLMVSSRRGLEEDVEFSATIFDHMLSLSKQVEMFIR